MFSKFKKAQTKNQKNTNTNKVNFVTSTNISVNSAVIVHSGNVLTVDDINKNRSSKYKYLAF